MKINRDNYEEFLILYMDNELNEADRRMVESFVNLHPDLKEELDILLQYKLTPDTDIIYEGKEDLLMDTTGKAKLEESLLYYIDDELKGGDKNNFEARLATDKSLQADLVLLLKTKVQPDPVIYPFKSSLYRTEKSYRIGIRWWRVAAAAILVLGIGFSTYRVFTNKQLKPELVKAEPAKKQVAPSKEIENQQDNLNNVDEQPVIQPQQTSNSNIALSTDVPNNKPVKVTNKEEKLLPFRQDTPEQEIIAANDNKPSNNLPDVKENPYVNSINNKPDAIQGNNVASIDKEALTKPAVTSERPQPYIVQASYNENDVMEPESKKNKLRGLFRKVTRTFEKRTNIEATDNDNKLLVAGLSINLK